MHPELSNTIAQLKAWFAPEAHKERDLPGGGKWFYIPWQLIRDRLDEVAPDHQVAYSTPVYLGDYCTITCTITIDGIAKQGIGNAEIQLLSTTGRNMARGTPIERATADAFKNAAEAWGCGRYLDEQTDPKTKAAFVKYMQQSGDGRAAANYHASDRPKSANKAIVKPFGQTPKPVGNNLLDSIDEAQAKHLWQTAQAAGYSEAGARSLLAGHGFDSFKSISRAKYNTILEDAGDRVLVDRHNEAGKETKP